MTALYSSLKILSYPEKIEAMRRGEITAPLHVRIKPINACNHRCWFCAYRASDLELGSEMKLKDKIPEAKMREVVEDLITMGVKAVTFSGGGEPLLYPYLVGTITQLGEAGIKVASLTNGTYLSGEVADAFARYGTWVRVSMDYWDEASCRKSRGAKAGEYQKIMTNLTEFAARRSACTLGVSYIVTQENADKLFDIAVELKQAGVHHVKYSPCIVSNSGEENNRHHDVIRHTVSEQLARAKELHSADFQVVDHYHQLETTFEKPYKSCHFLEVLTVIGADCKVYTCQDKAYTTSGCLGSIELQSFKNFWYSKENEQRIRSFDPHCECSHHCVANEKNAMLAQVLALDLEHLPFV